MKVRVLRVFKDKQKSCRYSINQVIEVSRERYEEINSTLHGLLVEAVEADESCKTVEVIEEDESRKTVDKTNFEAMTKPQLIEYCNKNNIQCADRMKKDEIILKIKGE